MMEAPTGACSLKILSASSPFMSLTVDLICPSV
jgi:hypothetical protein